MKPSGLARLRAALILQVRAGRLTARAAAHQLQVSRKTYYQWERRALRGLVAALINQRPGRPRTRADQEKISLRRQVRRLQRQLLATQRVARLRAILRRFEHRERRPKKGRSAKR